MSATRCAGERPAGFAAIRRRSSPALAWAQGRKVSAPVAQAASTRIVVIVVAGEGDP
jgi:hypothetical protein